MAPNNDNVGVPGIPYFTPKHKIFPGTLVPGENKNVPTLFKPLTIRGATLRNRILVAPMCQYSTAAFGPETGALTDYHIATLGHYALKGASLVFIEATGVQANDRISPNCPGLWTDAQIPSFRRVSDFLAHAGRKSSTAAVWVALRSSSPGKRVSARAAEDIGGWPEDVVGPMGGDEWTWDGKKASDESGGYWEPKALTESDIAQLVKDWASAADRAVKAGIDVIEIHAAHGYLINEFLSPITNQRTDKYGGSFDNRIRLLVEIIEAIRKVIPESMPLFLRISATDFDVEASIKLAKLLPGLGVDLLDVSSGGNHPEQQINVFKTKDYQIRIATRIRSELKKEGLNLLIGAIGLITEAEQARDIVAEDGGAEKMASDVEIEKEARAAAQMTEPSKNEKEPLVDVVLVARQFMREPEWVLMVAWKLGLDVGWPVQSLWIRFPKL
ncbi:NADH-dependent flavin oxidoreductase-like protein [Byssothecium circinans]|uniref:NADH-dependent flavin oxidoreductase-like protein n=1 Tax=Byssothecium circinans TaxID=147558 RepID=A0A6A5TM52_9PLEO|nr:NADH-dependent flavin oxidoreductase-like protein [Byssothecium circinans]